MTLGGLALAVGILVDDATVTIESINWHLEHFQPVEQAILDGAQQIALPALVSTLAICIVFIPMFMLAGIAKFLFVPLAEADRREEKLERLIIGLLLLAIPAAAFTASFAHDIVKILFERGRFDAAATDLTASLLRIYAFVLIPSMIGSPLARMLQIVGRTNLIHLVYLSNAIAIAMFGTLFVVWLGLDTHGIAWMLLTAATLSTTVTAALVARTGLMVRWGRVARYAFFAMVIATMATGLGLEMASQFNEAVMRLIMGGAMFGIVIGSAYFAARRRLLTISG
jgi:peptidoglycan biosynthesis protein MviN/MurJ (putative lipid II flippase)